jgi:hypothetical protein
LRRKLRQSFHNGEESRLVLSSQFPGVVDRARHRLIDRPGGCGFGSRRRLLANGRHGNAGQQRGNP